MKSLKDLKLKRLVVLVLVMLIAIRLFSRLSHEAKALDVSGDITANTNWTTTDSPYNLTGNVTIRNGATLTVDAGVVVQSNGYYRLTVDNGALVVNGASGNEVTFTSTSGTTANSWDGIVVSQNGSATIDYANISYSEVGVMIQGGSVSITNSTFTSNHIGVDAHFDASLTLTGNTFNSNTYVPLVLNPDIQDSNLTLGSNILGSSGNENGYDAIGIGYSASFTNGCPGSSCSIVQRNFAGISDIPYLHFSSYSFYNSADTFTIAAGVVIKHRNYGGDQGFRLTNGSDIVIAGTAGNEVVFTTEYDDRFGGDTNNDGTATSMSNGIWEGLRLESGSSLTADYAEFYGADASIVLFGSGTTGTIRDSL
ncbi:hypothetical protein GF357_01430, partial [Candidatus Dojkabacteria bacterium]|nr:hypothetical protein [Candidatus Dojkabacteria bacterium]